MKDNYVNEWFEFDALVSNEDPVLNEFTFFDSDERTEVKLNNDKP